MRTILFALLIFVAVPTPPHIDYFRPIVPAAIDARRRWPLVCDPALRDVVQFRWVAADGEAANQVEVEIKLRSIAEGVNWLFWRDGDSFTDARLPAWKVTSDCRLDVRFEDVIPSGTIPPDGATKLIAIEPDDSYCGFAHLAHDNRPGADNAHNASSFAAVSRRCLSAFIVAHEFLHMIGAVQPEAPHGLEDFHSSEFDIMGASGTGNCTVHDTIDCGNDDYFSLSPNGYLADYWNSADSIFLVRVQRYTVMAPLHMRYE